ncbi:NAD(P)-dependent dehydrogenase (short-subunit alcohol dehydrogenase family) [Saccharothrix ecbatanensis]|uniref:NAD(P)-dependent dehydrogenase (Short-subunit alcohol dehydrogenase family) n=1 Tax=Saccharothrix ecbatanensis TaxID=1105145 RepID=A0A7W9HRC9_9PSEU|nr:SDR family oxidoreductase [Saccharothrix ecbatanensis]MBB5807067.1 NAD(P)-dependent dehydrogenase (short-subunit alcohol dehydrogenase family) [Saccharothrix ecbatanensis]
MKIANSVALVTGANRGIGRHFARQLLERGAAKVYATARNPELVDLPGVEVLRLDITDPATVSAAATAAADVTLLVNNAGIITGQNLVTGDPAAIRLEMDTSFYGTLDVIRAFAPVLAANGGGAILNVLSSLSWMSYDGATAYCAAKAAQWSLTNGVRVELAAQGTLVTGLLMGPTDTDMTAGVDLPKNDPADVVRAALDGVEADRIEVLADELVVAIKAALAADPSALYPQVVGV